MQSSFFVFRFGLIVTICLTILCGDSSIAQEAATQEAPATQTKKEPSTEKSAPAEKQPMETKDEQSTAASTETDNGVKDDAKDESNSENNAKSEAEAARSAAHNEKGKSADSNTTTDEKKPKTAEKPRKQPKISVAEITLSGALSEGPSQLGLLGGAETKSLMSFLTRLHKAAEDNKVRSVLLNIQSAGLGRGQLHEVREAISKVRDSGKMVYAQMESGSTGEYLIACACDKIMMPESGTLMIPGIRAEVTFYKNLLSKLDVEADMMQVGDFKGAAEPMTRTQMSDAFHKQLESVLADYYDQMIETIGTDRSLMESDVKKFIDQAVFTAESAKTAGLIDIVAYEEAWEQELLAGSKDHQLAILEDYGKKKVDTDFSGMGGFIKMMELFSGGGKSKKRSKAAEKIAIVYAVGAINSGSSSSDPLMGGKTMGSDTIIQALAEADEDKNVAAIVLRVDSPGGSALASDLIWNKIETIEKPIIASMGNVAASGGYYISMGCDKIFAEPGTLTGSIGVVGGKIVTGGLMRKAGVTTDVISFGKNSNLFSTSEPFSPEGRKMMQGYMEETYEQFTTKAAAGREMELDELKTLAGGRVWTGRQAVDNGLVDELGSLSDAIASAQKLADLEPNDDPELMILPEQKTFFEEMFGGASATSPLTAAGQNMVPAPLRQQWADLFMLQQIFREPTACIMPCRINIQ